MIILELIYNLTLVVTLGVLSGFIDKRWNRNTLPGKILQGLMFGAVCIVGMLKPVVYAEGIIFDGRSIVISLASLFFGPVSGLLTTLMAAGARIYLGGQGIPMGLLVIFSSMAIGLGFYYWRKQINAIKLQPITLYLLGLVVHIVMLALVVALPRTTRADAFSTFGPTIIGIYPLITLILGKILLDQELNQKLFAELSDSQNLYRTLFNTAPVGIVLEDTTGIILDVNDTLCNELGYNRDFLIGKPVSALSASGNSLFISQNIQTIIEKKRLESEVVDRTRSGEKKVYNLTEALIELPGGKPGILSLAKDISAQKSAESESLRKALFIETLFDSVPNPLFYTNNNGICIGVNKAYRYFYGIEASEYTGKAIFDIYPQEKELYKSILNGEHHFDLSVHEVIAADGEIKNVIISTSPYYNEHNAIAGLIGSLIDITPQKQLEKNMLAAMEKALESDKLKTAFLNNLSHEIRTPLNAIIGFSGLLFDPGTTHQDAIEYQRLIRQSSHQLTGIINDIVCMATVETMQETVRLAPVSISNVIKQVITEFQDFIPAAVQLGTRISLHPDLNTIITDETKLTQVLLNLVGNAVKFTHNGKITICCRNIDGSAEFCVEDTGLGIAKEDHTLIFERFTQVEDHRTRKHGGTGLGLAISKAYIELMGGRIWVESEPGVGSKFYFTIPLAVEKKITDSATETELNGLAYVETLPQREEFMPHLASKLNTIQPATPIEATILVAEDDPVNQMLVGTILRHTGISIHWATNGAEAIEVVKERPDISLVIMDMKMPVMDGLQATMIIKELRPDLPVIALTAHAIEGARRDALNAGCDDYISKPFDKSKLLLIIRSYLGMQ